MKNWKRITALALTLVLLVCSLTGCSADKSEIMDTLEEFSYACRSLDVDALLNCIAPDTADPIRLGLALYSQATGQDYEDVTDGILDSLISDIFGSSYDPDDFLSTLRISDAEVTVDGDVAEVRCVVHFEVAGEKFARESSIIMVKELKKWYVAYVNLFA